MTGVPVSSAALIVPSLLWSVATVGRSFFESFVNSNRNGRWKWKLAAPTASVGGDLAIVSCRHFGHAEIASKVFAIFPNSAAWTLATGTTSAEAWLMFLKK